MDRIHPSFKDKIMTAEQAASMIQSNMVLGCSGFSRTGYSKAIMRAVAKRGDVKNLTVITGASVGAEMDGELITAGAVSRRYPYQNDKGMRSAINGGEVFYSDMHLSQLPLLLNRGCGPHIDLAVVECAAVTPEGLIPPASLGITDTVIRMADKVLIEVNTTIPLEIMGMHDVYSCGGYNPSCALALSSASERIGRPFVDCPPEKIAAIVETSDPGSFFSFKEANADAEAISGHIVDFLKQEVAAGRLPKQLPPIQSGTGTVANGVLARLASEEVGELQMFSEVLQDAALDLIDAGKLTAASATALAFSKEKTAHFYRHIHEYKNKIVIRPQEISNNPILIRSLGIIALNTALECDIYGNVNSSHQFGSRIMNGIGGSGDFARNASVSIFSTSSTAKSGAISCIVPMVSHVDHTEHDVQVIVTEQGLADLRWKSPKERAELIIERCAHPSYRPLLREYFQQACRKGGQTPHILSQALSWHERYETTGTMAVPE